MTPTEDTGESKTELSEGDERTKDEAESQVGLLEAKQIVLDAAEGLLETPLDGVIKVNETTDGNWRVVLEVIEREAVPDTQDMIGRYEFTLEPDGTLAGYNLVERYHRGDSKDEL